MKLIYRTYLTHSRKVRFIHIAPFLYNRPNFLLCLYAVYVGTVAGIYFNDFALVDKEGHAYLSTCFKRRGLQGVGGGVAFESGLGVGDFQLRLDGHFCVEDSFSRSIAHYVNNVTFLHEVHACDKVLGDRSLVEGFLVHEDVVLALLIEILELATLYAYVFKCFTDIEALFEYAATYYVLEGGTHDGVTLSRLHVQEVDAEIELAIHADAGALLDVL